MRRWPLENDYEIREKLGEGSFGRVMLCCNKINGEARAVKILKKSILIDPKVK
jgi:serine/threonine protein kinase